MRHLPSLFLFCCLLAVDAFSQKAENALENYVNQAMASNHSLQEQQFLLEKSMLALEEAKRLFLPAVGFAASYTLATGGRSISIPVGDLVNPVYTTLNQLTQTNQFPQIENVEEQFFPTNFYDARFRISQPVFNQEIGINRKLKAEAIVLKQTDIQLYKRELVKNVKTAYYQYLQATEAIKIYQNALDLLAENQRVNESLLRNDKIIPSVLTRVQSEIVQVKDQQNQARTTQKNAAAYFNFLLNAELDAAIEADEITYRERWAGQTAEGVFAKREELQQLATVQKINALVVDLESAYKLPQVGVQIDIGSQNFDFEYGGYVLGGISVAVPIWAANRNKLQVQQAELDLMATAEKYAQAKKQIALQIKTTENDLLAVTETWRSYQAQLANAERQYQDTFRRYKEGISNYLEVLDARNQVTNIELQQSLALFNILVKQAELERALAAYPLN